ncbi:MAG: lipocalin-like domain-containing protein [Alphaproteobacteria bacterium]|nr:MAG: lipocalin-like domain-containing protein [Alphaproteobacteria bacterium]
MDWAVFSWNRCAKPRISSPAGCASINASPPHSSWAPAAPCWRGHSHRESRPPTAAGHAANHIRIGPQFEGGEDARTHGPQFNATSVSEADRTIAIHIAGSSFPNWNDTDQKRTFVFAGDELKLISPAASGAGTAEVVWKRAK